MLEELTELFLLTFHNYEIGLFGLLLRQVPLCNHTIYSVSVSIANHIDVISRFVLGKRV